MLNRITRSIIPISVLKRSGYSLIYRQLHSLKYPDNIQIYKNNVFDKMVLLEEKNFKCHNCGVDLKKTYSSSVTLINTDLMDDPRDKIRNEYLLVECMGCHYLQNVKIPLLYMNIFTPCISDKSQKQILKSSYEFYKENRTVPHHLDIDPLSKKLNSSPIYKDFGLHTNESLVNAMENNTDISEVKLFFNSNFNFNQVIDVSKK